MPSKQLGCALIFRFEASIKPTRDLLDTRLLRDIAPKQEPVALGMFRPTAQLADDRQRDDRRILNRKIGFKHHRRQKMERIFFKVAQRAELR